MPSLAYGNIHMCLKQKTCIKSISNNFPGLWHLLGDWEREQDWNRLGKKKKKKNLTLSTTFHSLKILVKSIGCYHLRFFVFSLLKIFHNKMFKKVTKFIVPSIESSPKHQLRKKIDHREICISCYSLFKKWIQKCRFIFKCIQSCKYTE